KQAETVLRTAGQVEFVVSIGGAVAGAEPFESFLNSNGPIPEIDCDHQEDLVVSLYTSRTTGRPHGAMLTHGNLVANTRSLREAMYWRPGRDVVLLVLPMFHAFAATVGMLTPLTNGCAFVPLPRFEPDQVAEAIHTYRATIFLGVPSMYSVLLRLKD